MQPQFSVHICGLTDTGRARDHNEDAIAWDETHGFALLADGMGGHNTGDGASGMSIEKLNASLLRVLWRRLRLSSQKGVM